MSHDRINLGRRKQEGTPKCQINLRNRKAAVSAMSEEKRSVGRPSDYDAKFCETVISLGLEGASKAEMAAGCGVTKQTLDNWCDAHPEFFGAVKEAVAFSQAWWEKQGRIATFGGIEGFNATSFIFNMKNRFPDDWREKSEQTVNMKVSHEDALDELG